MAPLRIAYVWYPCLVSSKLQMDSTQSVIGHFIIHGCGGPFIYTWLLASAIIDIIMPKDSILMVVMWASLTRQGI